MMTVFHSSGRHIRLLALHSTGGNVGGSRINSIWGHVLMIGRKVESLNTLSVSIAHVFQGLVTMSWLLGFPEKHSLSLLAFPFCTAVTALTLHSRLKWVVSP